MRAFKYPNAIPPMDVRPVDDEGRWTFPWRAYFEAERLQGGGQGGDAIYEANVTALTIGEENRDRIEAVERLVRSQDAQVSAALASLGDLARLDRANARNLQRNTVGTRQVANDTDHFLVPSGGYATGALAQAAFDNLSIIAAPNLTLETGDLVDIEVDVYIEATADLFNHCYLTAEVARIGGSGASVLASRSIYLNHTDVSANMTSAGYEVPEQVTLRLRDTIPSTANDYRYRLIVSNALVSGNTFENYGDNSGARTLVVKEARIFATKFDPRLLG